MDCAQRRASVAGLRLSQIPRTQNQPTQPTRPYASANGLGASSSACARRKLFTAATLSKRCRHLQHNAALCIEQSGKAGLRWILAVGSCNHRLNSWRGCSNDSKRSGRHPSSTRKKCQRNIAAPILEC